jgi:predicted homoserine dehydrogenase-like protein
VALPQKAAKRCATAKRDPDAGSFLEGWGVFALRLSQGSNKNHPAYLLNLVYQLKPAKPQNLPK